MSVFTRLILTAVPIAVTWTLAWFGVFCFVNAYVERALGLSPVIWTRLTLCFIGGVVTWGATAAELSARIGRRRTLVGAMGLSSVLFGAIPFVTNVWVLGPLMALLGVMHGVFFGVWFPFVAAAGRATPGKAIAGTQFVFNTCSLLAILVAAPVMQMGAYRTLFLVFGAVMVLCTFLFAWLSAKLDEGNGKVTSIWRLRRGDMQHLFHGPFIWVALAGLLLEPFGFHTVNQLFPSLARNVHGMGEGAITVAVSVTRLPALLVLLGLMHLIDRLNACRCYGVGLLIGGAGTLAMGLVPAEQSLPLLSFLSIYYLGQGIVWGSNSTAVNRMVPTDLRDAAFACMGLILMLSLLTVGLVHNRLVEAGFTLANVFVISGLLVVVAGLTLIVRAGGRDFRESRPK
jgi:MFS family permease